MPVRSRTLFIVTVGSLMLLGIIAGAIGFSAAALTGAKSSSVLPPISLTDTTASKTETPHEPPVSATAGIAATTSPQAPRATSTAQPTVTVLVTTPLPAVIIVRYGESLYPVCRRNCTGIWSLNDVPPSLVNYAQAVSRLNGIPWNNGHPPVFPGQRLTMPPCPKP